MFVIIGTASWKFPFTGLCPETEIYVECGRERERKSERERERVRERKSEREKE